MADEITWQLLTSPAGRELVESLTPWDERNGLAAIEAARRDPRWVGREHVVSAAATQAALRTRAAARFPGPPRWWTSTGMEQATRPQLAAMHAALFAQAGAEQVLDLGCGVGSDSLALAAAGLAVTAVDRDPDALRALRATAQDAGLADRIAAVEGDLVEFVSRRDTAGSAIFLDPARRDASGRRLLDPQSWSPAWSWVVELARERPLVGAKIGPGIDRVLLPAGTTTAWTSAGGTLLEAAVWWGRLRTGDRARRTATVITADAVASLDDGQGLPDAPIGAVGDWLLEPDPAVIRAGLVALLCPMLNCRLLDPHIAYLTSDEQPAASPFARHWRVLAELPFAVRPMRKRLRGLGYGNVVVKKRGVGVVPEVLRAQLALRGGGPTATLVLTRTRDGPMALLVEAPQ